MLGKIVGWHDLLGHDLFTPGSAPISSFFPFDKDYYSENPLTMKVQQYRKLHYVLLVKGLFCLISRKCFSKLFEGPPKLKMYNDDNN